MTKELKTRPLQSGDLAQCRDILDKTEMFPSSMLADMVPPYLSGQAPHRWLVVQDGEAVVGFAYAEPERMTEGTINLLAIAVLPTVQRTGAGASLVAALEQLLQAEGNRILIVETSSFDEYDGARAFYDRLGFTREAQIRDFYRDGEDKILFWKRL